MRIYGIIFLLILNIFYSSNLRLTAVLNTYKKQRFFYVFFNEQIKNKTPNGESTYLVFS